MWVVELIVMVFGDDKYCFVRCVVVLVNVVENIRVCIGVCKLLNIIVRLLVKFMFSMWLVLLNMCI